MNRSCAIPGRYTGATPGGFTTARIETLLVPMKRWEASGDHRQNLLMAGARRVGVAAVDNPKSPYRKFWAMVITD
jgi:hypothetical protein